MPGRSSFGAIRQDFGLIPGTGEAEALSTSAQAFAISNVVTEAACFSGRIRVR